MKKVPLKIAEKELSDLLEVAAEGEEVYIVKDDHLSFKLQPIYSPCRKRVFGQYKDKIKVSSDFQEPLPDDFWNEK